MILREGLGNDLNARGLDCDCMLRLEFVLNFLTAPNTASIRSVGYGTDNGPDSG